jgi:hypothetical protein
MKACKVKGGEDAPREASEKKPKISEKELRGMRE